MIEIFGRRYSYIQTDIHAYSFIWYYSDRDTHLPSLLATFSAAKEPIKPKNTQMATMRESSNVIVSSLISLLSSLAEYTRCDQLIVQTVVQYSITGNRRPKCNNIYIYSSTKESVHPSLAVSQRFDI